MLLDATNGKMQFVIGRRNRRRCRVPFPDHEATSYDYNGNIDWIELSADQAAVDTDRPSTSPVHTDSARVVKVFISTFSAFLFIPKIFITEGIPIGVERYANAPGLT